MLGRFVLCACVRVRVKSGLYVGAVCLRACVRVRACVCVSRPGGVTRGLLSVGVESAATAAVARVCVCMCVWVCVCVYVCVGVCASSFGS